MFLVECQKNQARVRQTEPITSGSQNVYVVQFKLSEEWDPLTATAVFMAGTRIINVLLDDDRECMVPWEVMQYAGEQVMVGVFGTMNGNVILPTIWASMGNLQQGVTTGIYPSEPTPSVYQQIVNQLNRLRQQIENGIPYAIDGIVDTLIQNVDELSGLNLPRQVIMLNSGFMATDGKNISFNNGIVHLEYVDYLDTENNRVYAVRLTDYDGNVYDVLYDNFTVGGPFTTLVQVRNGDIRNDYELARSEGFTGTLAEWLESLKGKDGLNVVYYTGSSIAVDDDIVLIDHNLIIPSTNFTRKPVINDEMMIPIEQSEDLYFGLYTVTNVEDSNVTLEPKVVTRVSAKDGADGKDGNNALCYLSGTIDIDESKDIATDYNIEPVNVFNRAPVVGDVLMIPAIQGDITYFVIWKVTSLMGDMYVRLNPQSVTRVSPIDGKDGKDGRDPIYYVGETIIVRDMDMGGDVLMTMEDEISDPFMADRTIDNTNFTRTPVDGDVVTIPLRGPKNSCLVTYSVKEINEDDSVWQAVNLLNTTGSTGATGAEPLWGNFKMATKPYYGETVHTEVPNNGNGIIMMDEGSENTTDTIENPFNRPPVGTDTFSGVAVSTDPDNPFTCYVTGTAYISSISSNNMLGVTATFMSVTDIGGSSFTPDFITKEITEAFLNGEENVELSLDGVMGNEALVGLKEVLSKFKLDDESSVGISLKTITINVEDWTEITDTYNPNYGSYVYRYFYDEDTVETGKYIFLIFGVTYSEKDIYMTTLEGRFIGSTHSLGFGIYSRSLMSYALTLSFIIFFEPSDKKVIKHAFISEVFPQYNIMTSANVESIIAGEEINALNPIAGVEALKELLGNTSKTDYSTLRPRAISLGTTMPTTGLVNGALYGVYS